MKTQYKNYEYGKIEITKAGDDSRTWKYKIKNLTTGNKFEHFVQISRTGLKVEVLPYPIREVVETDGEYFIKKWLGGGREKRMRALVGEEHIEIQSEWDQ